MYESHAHANPQRVLLEPASMSDTPPRKRARPEEPSTPPKPEGRTRRRLWSGPTPAQELELDVQRFAETEPNLDTILALMVDLMEIAASDSALSLLATLAAAAAQRRPEE